MRARAWFVALFTLVTVMWMPHMHERVAAQSATGMMISEYRFRGPNGANDEFIELFNTSTSPVNIGGWMLRVSNNAQPPQLPQFATRVTFPANTIVRPGCFLLITNNNPQLPFAAYSGRTPANFSFTAGINDDGGIALTTAVATQIVDQVGQGTAPTAYGEGQRLSPFVTNIDRGIERRPGGTAGFIDSDDNFADYREISPGNPQNAASSCLVPQNIAITATASPVPAEQGQPLHVFARVFPGTVPPSTGINVVGDLSAVGGSPATRFVDDGVRPDLVAGDNIFTAVVDVPLTNPLGARSITLIATDGQNRRNSDTIEVRVVPPAVMYLPHAIQGAGATSPLPLGDRATVRGVVTARSDNGFYLQTEPGAQDSDPATSEGLFVYLDGRPPLGARIGHLVHVTGLVAELVPTADVSSPSITALTNVEAIFDFGAGTLPDPTELTSADISAAGGLDQLERLEGMRVHVASLMAVSGTGGVRDEVNAVSATDGAFFAVLNGEARPFREAGIAAGDAVPPCASGPCNLPLFDGNPERLRVDSDGLENVNAVNVTTGAVVDDVTAVIDFSSRTYTLLPEAELNPSAGMLASVAPAAGANQFTVASLHMDRFYDASGDPDAELVVTDAAFETRLAKASAAVRNVLQTPDVIGVQDVESLVALTALAQRIDADALMNAQPAPQYSAHLFEGADQDGLDVGFLVKTAGGRVTVNSVEPIPGAAQSRPPVVLRATLAGPSTMLPQQLTVIVNQLSSRAGIETDAQVRADRKAQAEFLAGYIQMFQGSEAIVSLGDYNAFSFNDGYVDVVGTVAGSPAGPDQVVVETNDLVSPDLMNVSNDVPPAERYSSIANGNAQALEHVLVSANLVSQFNAAVRPRFNADFPEALRGDASTPVRMADRDPVVAYFTFPADETAPVISNLPGDRTVEAETAAGAAVSYEAPTATDNLDGEVAVTCAPASGSVFPLGNTGVTCSAHDANSNVATEAFTVSVVDTTAPTLTVPANVTIEALSAAGAPLLFGTTATDLVTAAPAVTCTPASGGVFPLGTTNVQCTATDDASNSSTASFLVTVVDTTPPLLTVPANVTGEATSSEGRVVTFTASAIDAVTGSPTVSCTPASGSTFAIGETVVTCAAADAAGNVATGTFTVTVTSTTAPPVFGHLAGVGAVVEGDKRVWFAFDVKETTNTERGWVMVQVRPVPGKPDRYLSAQVIGVQMSDEPGYTPSRSRTGIDTVVFSGMGSWNGVSGHRYEITASDRGEPGRGRDMFSLKIFSPAGVLVESVSGVLRDGNIQSLR